MIYLHPYMNTLKKKSLKSEKKLFIDVGLFGFLILNYLLSAYGAF